MIRRVLFLVSLAVAGAALVLVPVPLLVLQPGGALPVADPENPVITVDGRDVDTLSGDFLLTTVSISSEPTVGLVQAALDDAEQVITSRSLVPAGIEPEEYLELQRDLFRESIRFAGAAGARAAGLDVTVRGDGAQVVRVLPGTPADGVLEQGDVIVGVDGRDVGLSSEVVTILEGRSAGDEVTLQLERGDERITQTVRLTRLPDTERPGLGVLVRTMGLSIDTPVDVEPADDVRIGGPSAGLMFALTVFDLVDDEDLLSGRRVAGTGTIDLDGGVGPISGVAAKVEAAVDGDADLFLAPESQAGAARDASDGRIDVIGVRTLDGAISALRER